MSSVQYLREFINERLTAAAEQIFLEFEKTIVQYEQEIDRQRRLMDITWKPEIKLHRTDVPQQHVCKEEEVVADQQLWNQETSPNLDQGEPEPPQIKEEQEQLCSSQEGEQLVLKEEIHAFMVTAAEEKDHSEPEPKRDHLNCVSSAVAVREYQGAGKKEGHNNVEYQPTPDSQYPDVQVQVIWSSTGPQLICESSCFPSGHSSFVWYKNEEEILGESSSLYTKYADGPDSYSCAYEGHRSNPVCRTKPSPMKEWIDSGTVDYRSCIALLSNCAETRIVCGACHSQKHLTETFTRWGEQQVSRAQR